jgi:alpha-D-xyloside xylohydrolase
MKVVIGHPAGTYNGAPAARRYIVRIHGLSTPIGMRVNNGTTLPAFTSEAAAILNGSGQVWDAGKKVLSVVTATINVAAGGTAAVVDPSGAAFPTPSAVTVYEVEDALLSGVARASQHAGYTGSGYVDYTNAANDYVEWTVSVATGGEHTLDFRYANGGTTDRPLAISVNGTVVKAQQSFPPTGSWAIWGNSYLTATLPSGSSVKIRATATGSNGSNLDSLTIR